MTSAPRRKDWGGGLTLIGGFAIGWMGVLGLVGVMTLVMIVVGWWQKYGGDTGLMMAEVNRLQKGDLSGIPSWALAATMTIQFPAMLGLVFVVHFVVDRVWFASRPELVARPLGWAGVFALRGTHWVSYAAAAVIGLTVGMLPGWFAEQLRAYAPDMSSTIELINDALTKGPLVSRLVMIACVAVVGPVVEELVFRGFMWDALRKFTSPLGAMIGSSILFAVYHMDPVQSTALLITAFTLGWVRWVTGSIWPCVVVHIVNNSLGVLAAYVALDGSTAMSFGTAAVSLATAVLLGVHHVRRIGPLASDTTAGG